MGGIEDGKHFVGRVDLVLLALNLGCTVIDGVVDFVQEGCCGCCEPPATTQLEGSKMASPVGGAQ